MLSLVIIFMLFFAIVLASVFIIAQVWKEFINWIRYIQAFFLFILSFTDNAIKATTIIPARTHTHTGTFLML